MRNWIIMEKNIIKNFYMVIGISKKEFKKDFAGSKLGIMWAIIRPLAMIFVFWFIFSVGFKTKPIHDVPYILWLISGYVPWIFISDVILGGAGSIRANSFLVKKVRFPLEILPLIKIAASFYTFIILLLISFTFFASYGFLFKINILKLIYCIISSLLLLSALSRLLSAWVVMSIDVLHALTVLIQFLFWMTPVMWDVTMYNISLLRFLKINPFYYIITGYRDAFLNTGALFNQPLYTIYFWIFTIILFVFSTNIFNRLRPEFDDVL